MRVKFGLSDAAIARITLSKPDRRNAMTGVIQARVTDCWIAVDANDSVLCLLETEQGGS